MLVILVTGRAVDKVQGSSEGEGAAAWRAVHEQWEPRSRKWFAGMLPSILSYRFTRDAQAAIEALRCVRESEGQSTPVLPDFVEAGIVINGIDANEKLKQEVFDIARAKGALGTASTSSHVEVDACCRGKGKERARARKRARTRARVKMTARNQDTDASKTEKCFF